MWVFFFFKQKTAYEMRISDWSSDVCSSDRLILMLVPESAAAEEARAAGSEQLLAVRGSVESLTGELRELTDVAHRDEVARAQQPGRASCRERGSQYV